MSTFTRRSLVRRGPAFLAALGSLPLAASAALRRSRTAARAEDLDELSSADELPVRSAATRLRPTPGHDLGHHHRAGAPFRAKLAPPCSSGEVIVVRGRVLDASTGRPVAGAVLDLHHADARAQGAGRYDDQGWDHRARAVTDERGRYEYETIRPEGYFGASPHVHYVVSHPAHATLETALFFRGHLTRLAARRLPPELVTDLTPAGDGRWSEGTFDVVLEPARRG